MEDNNRKVTFGNVTTILNSIIVILAGYIFGFLVSIFGVGLPFNETQLASFLSALVFAGFSYLNARYHNTFWDSEEDTLSIPLDSLNDQQIKAIKNFIENCTVSNLNDNSIASLDEISDPTKISSSDEELEITDKGFEDGA